MSIDTKRAKLRFIAQEMELAQRIATHAPTPFVARIIARHVLTRTQDFIAIARDVPSLLRARGEDTSKLKARIKAFADTFDEYYATTRTKIAAHVQDVEWVERLELWTDIEVVKLTYFVEGAREIYDALATHSLPSYAPYAQLPELNDSAFQEALDALANSRQPDGLVRMAADPLAATRPDTLSSLNFTPVHQRAGQLAAIDLWIQEQLGLLSALKAFPNAERILRARLLTDLVSFADCLRTRPDGDPAHRMDGLDDLVRTCNGGDPSAIDEMRNVYRFEETVTRLRGVRNRFGGHFHRDDTHDVAALVAECDAITLRELLLFYRTMSGVFAKTCERTFFLGTYRLNNAPVAAVIRTAGRNEYVQPFDETRTERQPAPPRFVGATYSLDTFAEAVCASCEGGPDLDHAHTFVSNALLQHALRGRKRGDGTPLPEPHAYLLDRLLASTDRDEARRLLAIIARCARGAPEPLAELLLAYRERTDGFRSGAATAFDVCEVLAEMPIRDGEWARAPIVELAVSQDPLLSAPALRWLFRRLAEDRDMGDDSNASMTIERLAPLIAQQTPRDRLLALLAIGSLFFARTLLQSTADRELDVVFRAVASSLKELRTDFASDPRFVHLLGWRDCVSLCVLVGEELLASDPESASIFYKAVASRVVIPTVLDAVRAQAQLNRAIAHFRLGEKEATRALAARLFDDPLAIELQLAAIPLLLEADAPAASVKLMLDDIKAAANIGPELATLAAQAEMDLAKYLGAAGN